MGYRLLGTTGVRVSELCLGTLNFGGPTPEREALRIISRSLDAGVNFIDTANTYSDGESERIVGRALARGRRQNVILATKVGCATSNAQNDRGASRRHIMTAVEDSLRRLQTDWIDLYQIHTPMFDLPQIETLRVLDDLVHDGKVRYIGSSNFPAWVLMEGLAISDRWGLARYVTEQPPYNLLDRRIENELVPLAERYNLGLLAWSPLAGGLLAGRYERVGGFPQGSRAARVGSYVAERVTDRGIRAARQLAEVARARGLTPCQLGLLWVKDQAAVTSVIIGPRTEAHLEDALPVLEMNLDEEAATSLDEIVPPGSAAVDFHAAQGWMKMRLLS